MFPRLFPRIPDAEVVPVARRPAESEAIIRINYATVSCSFILDFKEVDTRSKIVVQGDSKIDEPMIDFAIRRSLDLADQYFAAVVSVAFGNCPPGTSWK
jgi:hypothetical protein